MNRSQSYQSSHSRSISYNKLLEIDTSLLDPVEQLSISPYNYSPDGKRHGIHASVAQIDDIVYHKEDLNYHIIDIIKKETREKRKKRQNKKRESNISSSVVLSLPNIANNVRIKNSLSPRLSKTNKKPISAFTDDTEIGSESLLVDYVPGHFFKSNPPQYCLPTSTQQIVSLLHPEYSYAHKWNRVKESRDDVEDSYKSKLAKNEMILSFRQFINSSEKLVLSSSLQTLREIDLKRKQITYNNNKIKESNNKYIAKLNKINENNTKYMHRTLNKHEIQASIAANNRIHEYEIKKNKIKIKGDIKKFNVRESYMDSISEEKSKRFDFKVKLSKDYLRLFSEINGPSTNDMSLKLKAYALAKSNAILNAAAKVDCNISIHAINSSDYFISKQAKIYNIVKLKDQTVTPITDVFAAEEEYVSSLAMSEYLERSQQVERLFEEDYTDESLQLSN